MMKGHRLCTDQDNNTPPSDSDAPTAARLQPHDRFVDLCPKNTNAPKRCPVPSLKKESHLQNKEEHRVHSVVDTGVSLCTAASAFGWFISCQGRKWEGAAMMSQREIKTGLLKEKKKSQGRNF